MESTLGRKQLDLDAFWTYARSSLTHISVSFCASGDPHFGQLPPQEV